MKIVVVSETFVSKMGYLENLLPKYLARCGAQVEVVASSLSPDYRNGTSRSSYAGFADNWEPGVYEMAEGFRLHVLRPVMVAGYVRLAGLAQKLQSLRPQIVQTMTPIGWIAVDASWNRLLARYKLFSGCHHHASVFPLAQQSTSALNPSRMKCFFLRGIPGRLASRVTEKYYAISKDCADVAVRFFGVPRNKVVVSPLGVDTEIFHPLSTAAEESARWRIRSKYGISEDDIVCIYTGRFSKDKNPFLLAKVIDKMTSEGHKFKGLFVGNGEQAFDIGQARGCYVHSFVPRADLADLYRSADIAVWPTQESMSMLDAAACGLPIVANHTIQAPERLEGNGATYRLLDPTDLQRILLGLRCANTRQKLGATGAEKMAQTYSWQLVANHRLRDYEEALRGKAAPTLQ